MDKSASDIDMSAQSKKKEHQTQRAPVEHLLEACAQVHSALSSVLRTKDEDGAEAAGTQDVSYQSINRSKRIFWPDTDDLLKRLPMWCN